jgi:hypothetical protein
MTIRLLACAATVAICAAAAGADRPTGSAERSETAIEEMSEQSPTESSGSRAAASLAERFGWLWFPGAIALYFALQLWILPKMGVPT